MGPRARSANGDLRRDERNGTTGPGISIPLDERHALAVRQSLRWAERAASEGDYERALGWLRMVEQVDGRLDAAWRERRKQWSAAWTAQFVQRNGVRRRTGASADEPPA